MKGVSGDRSQDKPCREEAVGCQLSPRFLHRSRYNQFSRRTYLACPYFVPRERLNDGSWPHPARLPLGAGWYGSCCANGSDCTPPEAALHDFCNLGNAHACPNLPPQRDWDAIRFSVALVSEEQLTLWYVCERGHAPVEYGKLTYDRARRHWSRSHPDARVQRLATAYVETRHARHIPVAIELEPRLDEERDDLALAR